LAPGSLWRPAMHNRSLYAVLVLAAVGFAFGLLGG
jgi:hypothetical protein